MFAITASTRTASRITPSVMNALNYTHGASAHNSRAQPIGLGLCTAGTFNANNSTITVEPPTPSTTRPIMKRSSTSHWSSCNSVCMSPAAPVLNSAATLPPMLFSPGPTAPDMLHPPVMPWVFTPPASSTPATAGHEASEQEEGYFPSLPAQNPTTPHVHQSNTTRNIRPDITTHHQSFIPFNIFFGGGSQVPTNFVLGASAYLEAYNANVPAAHNNTDSTVENVGLGLSNMRISDADATNDTEMLEQPSNANGSTLEEDGWDADVEMDENDVAGFRTLKSCKERIPTPYYKPRNSCSKSWSHGNLEIAMGQDL